MENKIFNGSEIFEKNYRDYCTKIAGTNFNMIKDVIGADIDGEKLVLKLLGENYYVSEEGITDEAGNIPDYRTCIILSKYILLAPEKVYSNFDWVSFKDFKRESHFTNVNFFTSDVERLLIKHFSSNIELLKKACDNCCGKDPELELSYDLIMKFEALPRLSLLLLFNDMDEDFAPKATILFEKHAEYYLDPESLAITAALLVEKLADFNQI